MRRSSERVMVAVAVAVAVLALGPLPASQAHQPAGGAAEWEPGMFGQQPIALPVARRAEPSLAATPKAKCGPGSNPEPGLQGRVSAEDVASGKAEKGYWCNLTQIGHSGSTGGFKVLRYVDRSGRECAYYDTTLLFPVNAINLASEATGVAVLDMSNPAKPLRTATLLTPAMQTPHESVNISVKRGLLAAVMGSPAFHPGHVDVYDLTADCRHPVLRSSLPVGTLGHESGMAPDGMTFYATSISTGHVTAVDLTNPAAPLPLWVGQYNSHGLSVSDDGNRAYIAASEGLIILDVSEIQARKPDPQAREISRLTWSNLTIPQIAIPVTIAGKPYVVEVDEFSKNANGDTTAHGDVVGAARIIDIADETKPRVVSNMRLEVHQPEHRAAIASDPGAQFVTQGYAGHYCNVPQRREPGIFACSFINSGLRVFDIRDPLAPKELAYFVAPPSTKGPTATSVIDERANYAMSSPDFAPERGEIWYSDGNSGFYALRLAKGVWPFAKTAQTGGCVDNAGLTAVSAKRSGSGVQLRFTRKVALPVRVDVFRVSDGRRVLGERLVARFGNRTKTLVWDGVANVRKRHAVDAGYYFVRFTMLKDGRAFDTRRIVLQRAADGAFTQRADHYRRDSCGLLGKFKLERPVFGGTRTAALKASYRLTSDARVTITVTRGRKLVKRFAGIARAANRTFRISLRAKALPAGDYRIRLQAVRGSDKTTATLTARRL